MDIYNQEKRLSAPSVAGKPKPVLVGNNLNTIIMAKGSGGKPSTTPKPSGRWKR